jgi:ribosomal protein L37AE/L43A
MKHLLMIHRNFIPGRSQDDISTKISQSMKEKYSCPCCSNTLLRHIRSGVVYWRCSYCYQEMPI